MLGAETAEFVGGAGCPATSSCVEAEPPAAFSAANSADAPPPPDPEVGCDRVYMCVCMRAYQVSSDMILLPYIIWIIVYMA
jgi:hypothetical protein